uniref:Uncharacterized protein n=1 Tax=Strongyloides stercoralis TaxID=6248 RepID=A0AAF5I388_STRER
MKSRESVKKTTEYIQEYISIKYLEYITDPIIFGRKIIDILIIKNQQEYYNVSFSHTRQSGRTPVPFSIVKKLKSAFLYSGVRIVIADEKNEYMKYIYNDINNCLLNMSKGGRKINVRMFEIEGIAPLWVENQELISAIKFIPRL